MLTTVIFLPVFYLLRMQVKSSVGELRAAVLLSPANTKADLKPRGFM